MLFVNVLRYLKSLLDPRPANLYQFSPDNVNHSEELASAPSVAIIIPTRDRVDLLGPCIESLRKTDYPAKFEIVVVDNESSKPETLAYMANLSQLGVKVIRFDGAFNFSAICNFAIQSTESDFICLLNDDTEAKGPSWLKSLVQHALNIEVGVVGSVLSFPNGNLQHAGISFGYQGVAGYPFVDSEAGNVQTIPNECFEVSAVSFACALFSRITFDEIGPLDERFASGLNDVLFCMASRNAKKKNIICIKSNFLHHESASRGKRFSARNVLRHTLDVLAFLKNEDFKFDDAFFTKRKH